MQDYNNSQNENNNFLENKNLNPSDNKASKAINKLLTELNMLEKMRIAAISQNITSELEFIEPRIKEIKEILINGGVQIQ